MAAAAFRIGVVAPAGRFSKRSAERAVEMAALRPGRPIELEFHPQCFLTSGHFAGPDEARKSEDFSIPDFQINGTAGISRSAHGIYLQRN